MRLPGKKIVRMMDRLKNSLTDVWEAADQVARNKATGAIEAQQQELNYIFALLVQGSFVGMPGPPVQICMDLLPLMEKDLILLRDRVETANEPLSRLFSVFDIS